VSLVRIRSALPKCPVTYQLSRIRSLVLFAALAPIRSKCVILLSFQLFDLEKSGILQLCFSLMRIMQSLDRANV
jgi:hypothetical protein